MTSGGGVRLGGAPMVLGDVVVGDATDLTATLFDALACTAAGADGVVLTFDETVPPTDRLEVAGQVADTTSADVLIRSEMPMASCRHRQIVPPDSRRGSHLVEISMGAADMADPEQSVLTIPTQADEGALIGSVVAAVEAGLAAVATDRPRIARRTIDVVSAVEGARCDRSTVRSASCP